MNRRGFFGLLGATFVVPFLPRKAEQKPVFIGQNQIPPEQVQLWLQNQPHGWDRWLGQESGNLYAAELGRLEGRGPLWTGITPYQNTTFQPWMNAS